MYRFIVRKYIFAESATEAIAKDKKCPVHDCFVDGDWLKIRDERNEIGYDAPKTKKIGEK